MRIPTFLLLTISLLALANLANLVRGPGPLLPCVISCDAVGDGVASPTTTRDCEACIALPRSIQSPESQTCAIRCRDKKLGFGDGLFNTKFCENCYLYGSITYDWSNRGRGFRYDKGDSMDSM
jgi:hypothetical protein